MILASEDRIKEFTAKGCWTDRTLLEDFHGHVSKFPEREAVIDPYNKEQLLGTPPQRVKYAEIGRAVEAVATALVAEGLRKDDVILVQLPNCWELAMLYLAVTRAGGLLTPVPMQWRAQELTYVAGLTEAKAIITVKSFHDFPHLEMAEKVAAATPSVKKVYTYEDLLEMIKTEPDPAALDRIPLHGNDIFTLCWTSGTEAKPKGCPLSHNNWRCQAALAGAGGVEPYDTMLTAGPLVNMASIGTVYIPWIILGGTMVLHHPFEPPLLLKQMVAEKINYTLLVPAVVNLILKHPLAAGVDLGSIRSITVGSAPPSLWAMEEFKKRWGIDIGNIWGQNEGTAIISGVRDVPDMATRVDCLPRYGTPGVTWSIPMSSFIQTKVVDGLGNTLTKEGDVGELLYRGPNVIPGYFKRPDLNEKSFDEEGYIHTGDLFQLKGDRYLKFFDRAKDIIIRGGYNISAQEVENALLGLPGVQDVAAVAMPDENLGERVCVYVVPAKDQEVSLESVKKYMQEQGVAVYKMPERLEIVSAIPRNPVGKILKNQLREDLRAKLSRKAD